MKINRFEQNEWDHAVVKGNVVYNDEGGSESFFNLAISNDLVLAYDCQRGDISYEDRLYSGICYEWIKDNED